MDLTWTDIWKYLLQVVLAGGGAALVVYKLAANLADKWLDNRFAEKLQELKHIQDLEIERVRHEVQRTFSRISKVHDREFEVLPKLWSLLHEAHGSAFFAIARALGDLPDFSVLDAELLDAVCDARGLSTLQKQRMMEATDKHGTWIEILRYRLLHQAKSCHLIFNNYLIENHIFLSPELHTLLREASDALALAITNHEVGERHGIASMMTAANSGIETAAVNLEPIRLAIQKRLGQTIA